MKIKKNLIILKKHLEILETMCYHMIRKFLIRKW